MIIIQHKNILLAVGIAIMLASAGIVATLGLNLGIDFTGGSLTEVAYGEPLPEGRSLSDYAYGEEPEAEIESALESLSLDLGGFSVRHTETDDRREGFIVRTRDLTEDERITIDNTLVGLKDGGEILRFTSIGPVIGQELREKAKWAIGGVVVVIILYVSLAFLGVGKPVSSWVYGGITIFALAHDVLVPTAVMSLLGYFAGIEVDVLFVMALLAVLGYSVNDTIVVFDRVRENLLKYRQEKKIQVKDEYGQKQEEIEYVFTKPFATIVGESIDQTLLRSINTSVTTFLALLALYIFGGDVTNTFALILIAGVAAGTYSSIALASPLLVWYAERQAKGDAK